MSSLESTPNSHHILGIDIGGSFIKAGVIAFPQGVVSGEPVSVTTPDPATPEAITETISQVVHSRQWTGRVGVGYPGVVKDGIVQSAAHVDSDWIGRDIREQLEAVVSCRVSVINDADAAAIAEMNFGAGRDHNHTAGGVILVITLGTGIGSAIFNNGCLLPNTEFGHTEIDGVEAEERASARTRKKENLDWPEYGARVNRFLQEMENLISFDKVIIGGGIVEQYEKFFSFIKIRAPFVVAAMGNQAGMIGAAYYAYKRYAEHE